MYAALRWSRDCCMNACMFVEHHQDTMMIMVTATGTETRQKSHIQTHTTAATRTAKLECIS